jgi:hypothetical protein
MNLQLIFIIIIIILLIIIYLNKLLKKENFQSNMICPNAEKMQIQYFINKYPSNIIDCKFYNNKNECMNGYQCDWIENESNSFQTNGSFCTGNILGIPK